MLYISIHALREEGDDCNCRNDNYTGDFYPRPPRGGRPDITLPTGLHNNFYPRPPRGGRRRVPRLAGAPGTISIHALREEGDPTRTGQRRSRPGFLSTPSARRATTCIPDPAGSSGYFYPRPPRGGRPPLVRPKFLIQKGNFYPRPPRGGRRLYLACSLFE